MVCRMSFFVAFWGFCVLQGWWGVIEYKSCGRVGIKALPGIGFWAAQVDRGYLPDRFFRENEVDGLWGSI